MPRKKKATKKVASKTVNADEVSSALNALEPGAALAALLEQVRSSLEKSNDLAMEVAALKTTIAEQQAEARAGGLVNVGGPDDDFVIPVPEGTVNQGPFALWRSPSPGFQQVLIRSMKKRYENGETEIIPAVIAPFDRGVCVLTDEEEITLMRIVEQRNMEMGVPVFVEITDPEQMSLARKGLLHSRNITSKQGITPDSTMADIGL